MSGMISVGAAMSTTLDAETTTTENGKTKTESFSTSITISIMPAPEKTIILQMNADNSPVSRSEHEPGAMPETITTEASTEYIIVETQKRDEAGALKADRKIYGRDDDNIETFFARADGICVKHYAQIIWE